MQYKPGDRIRSINYDINVELRDCLGTIMAVEGTSIWIKIDDRPSPSGAYDRSWMFREGQFTLEEAEPSDEEIAALFNVKPCTQCGCATNGRH